MTLDLYRRRDELTEKVIGCAIEVHKALGPGLLERIYEECLFDELHRAGLSVERQKPMPITYKERIFSAAFKMDLLVNNQLVIELKTVEALLPVHEAQILTYMKLSKVPLGLLMNFNAFRLVDGLKRMILDIPAPIVERQA
jgi:GxxExxY protein